MIRTSLLDRYVRIDDGACGIIRGVYKEGEGKLRYIVELSSGRLSEYYVGHFTMDTQAEEPVPVELEGDGP